MNHSHEPQQSAASRRGATALAIRCSVALIALLCAAADQPAPRAGGDPLAGQPVFLPVDEAFVLTARREGRRVVARWDMPEGYYLYRHAFSIQGAAEAELGVPAMPDGERKVDEYFGDTEVYYGSVEIAASVGTPAVAGLTVLATYQGCADYGLCYPPQRRSIAFAGSGSALVSKAAPRARTADVR